MAEEVFTAAVLWKRKHDAQEGYWAAHAQLVPVTLEELEALEEAAFTRGQNNMLEAGYHN